VTEVTWKEPPDRQAGLKFEREAREMREHPGKWLLLDDYPPEQGQSARSMANSVKIGRYTALRPAGAFEARTATEENGSGDQVVNVYARYTGDAGG
jgi:hypothetical protein